MTRETFKPSSFIHLLGPGLCVFFACLAYRSCVDEFVHGGMLLRVVLVGACALFSLGTAWLYVRGGLLIYTITEEGLELRRLSRREIIPWDHISEIRWNRPLHYFSVRSADGVICFSSTDEFSNVGDLLDRIYQKSHCKIPAHLKLALYGDGDP